MTDIVIQLGTQAAPVTLVLRAEAGASGFLEVKKILLTGNASLLAQATLPTPIPVPIALLAANGADQRFLTAGEIDQRVQQLVAQNQHKLAALIEAQREDVARRFRSVQVNWGDSGAFLAASSPGRSKAAYRLRSSSSCSPSPSRSAPMPRHAR